MFRGHWERFESNIGMVASELREVLLEKLGGNKSKVEKFVNQDPKQTRETFVQWGKDYVHKVKAKADGEKAQRAKDNFIILLRNLGVNEQVIFEAFRQNRKEVLDPLIGETVALVALVLGWQHKDREAFSQALGEIGVAGVFAAKPFLCLIAICGLAYGYQENFHPQAFKKGGVLGLAGMTAVALTPGAFTGLLAAIVTILYLNKRLKIERPIETQLKELLMHIRSGGFFKEVRGAWRNLEAFLSRLFTKVSPSTEVVASS
jgi:hypothetical protein